MAPRPALARQDIPSSARSAVAAIARQTALAGLLACLTGCFDDQPLSLPPPDANPPTSQRLVIGPGEFVEANFVVDAPGATVTAQFASAGEFEWNLHRHDRADFRLFEIVDTGAARDATLEFTAASDGLFSYQWTNASPAAGFALEIDLTLDGPVTLHSWD